MDSGNLITKKFKDKSKNGIEITRDVKRGSIGGSTRGIDGEILSGCDEWK